MPSPIRFPVILLALALAGCAPSAKVRHITPPEPVGVAPATTADRRQARRDPLAALAWRLDTAREWERRLVAGDRSPDTLAAYNHAVARVAETIDRMDLDAWSAPATVPSAGGTYRLRARLARSEPGIHPADYRLIPTDTLDIGGAYFTTLSRHEGLGAPLAVVARKQDHTIKHDLTESAVYGSATAVLSFRGRDAELIIYESLRTDTVTFGGRTWPLAADYSAPLALLIAHQKIDKLGLVRLLNPGRYAETARLTRLQLYCPDRIPVLMIHGLDSTPATWMPMINLLRADPDIRRHYQFWVFSYPSGYPYPYSAHLLRQELDAIGRRHPGHKPIVLMGHSMGGIISRLMLTDSGDTLWRTYFGKPPSQTKISGKSRRELEGALVFRHRREIGRTLFFAAPHRGSDIAVSRIGRLAARLVRAPAFLADVRDAVISVATADTSAIMLERVPSSIDTLSPDNRFVLAVNELPLVPTIPYHSIIGDRGKGGNKDRTKPVSSDGVVPYWSSHLDGAASEKIVPSDHAAHQHPGGITEARRILRLHAGLSPK